MPPKEQVYTNMEALIYHFKIVMGEVDTPKAEVYHAVEGANGELGFYLVHDGGRLLLYRQVYQNRIHHKNSKDFEPEYRNRHQ